MPATTRTFRRYTGSAPADSLVVRVVKAGDDIVGFIHQIEEPGQEDSTYPTEQKPLDQLWRLVDSKLEAMPDAVIYVELEAGIDWHPEWGRLAA